MTTHQSAPGTDEARTAVVDAAQVVVDATCVLSKAVLTYAKAAQLDEDKRAAQGQEPQAMPPEVPTLED